MVSGSLAMITYTIPRMTRDIDLVINLNEFNLENFKSIFQDRFYFNETTLIEETKKRGMFNLIDHETGFKIDFIIRKNSEYRLVEFERKIKTDFFGFPCFIVSREDLILSKLIWIQELQSNTQIEDIKNLVSDTYDKEYVKYWINRLNLKLFNLIF